MRLADSELESFAEWRNSYFPTVYEPTVFENYVHGASAPQGDSDTLVGRARTDSC